MLSYGNLRYGLDDEASNLNWPPTGAQASDWELTVSYPTDTSLEKMRESLNQMVEEMAGHEAESWAQQGVDQVLYEIVGRPSDDSGMGLGARDHTWYELSEGEARKAAGRIREMFASHYEEGTYHVETRRNVPWWWFDDLWGALKGTFTDPHVEEVAGQLHHDIEHMEPTLFTQAGYELLVQLTTMLDGDPVLRDMTGRVAGRLAKWLQDGPNGLSIM